MLLIFRMVFWLLLFFFSFTLCSTCDFDAFVQIFNICYLALAETLKLGQIGHPVHRVVSSIKGPYQILSVIYRLVFRSLCYFNCRERIHEACRSLLCICSVYCNVLAFICHVAFQLACLFTLWQYRNTKTSAKEELLNGNCNLQLQV